jgi:P2 family phage contractile tail tube protein
VEELTLPKLTLKTEEFRNGGMDAPIEVEMGMEKLESEFTLTRFDKNGGYQFHEQRHHRG